MFKALIDLLTQFEKAGKESSLILSVTKRGDQLVVIIVPQIKNEDLEDQPFAPFSIKGSATELETKFGETLTKAFNALPEFHAEVETYNKKAKEALESKKKEEKKEAKGKTKEVKKEEEKKDLPKADGLFEKEPEAKQTTLKETKKESAPEVQTGIELTELDITKEKPKTEEKDPEETTTFAEEW